MIDPIVPAPAPADKPKLFYRRGRRWPRAIAWFGFKSFWGHIWHLLASVVATEDIDSRDWMQADDPDELTKRVGKELGGASDGASLTEIVGRDVWIDFVADTGDDFSISKAVARLVAADYEVDGERLPRGDVLVFGGDTAYPVATDIEIHNRVIVPWNQVLKTRDDGKHRVLLGVPGNHDWFAGLDGFGRMFRRRRVKLAHSDEKVDRLGQIGHLIDWVEAFRVGKDVVKRAALVLTGYQPVQSASYFRLELAPALEIWGVDRQLRSVDFQQRAYFADARDAAVVLCVADPVHAFLEPNPAGVQTLAALGLTLEDDGPLVLTGDTHHYCRQRFGPAMHVIAGGGGAFLHPACIARSGVKKEELPEAEFPGPKTTLALALQVPWQIVHGRSGFLIHGVLALFYGPLFFVQWSTGGSGTIAASITAVVATLACIGLGGWRHKFLRIALLSIVTGLVMGFLPTQAHLIAAFLVRVARISASPFELAAFAYAIAVYGGTLALGTYLMLLTVLGLEQHQALSALAHPGYKHFVRLRVRKDGTAIDGWVLGRVDPLNAKDEVVLVDKFTWKNPQASSSSSASSLHEGADDDPNDLERAEGGVVARPS